MCPLVASRRDFLKITGAGVAGTALASATPNYARILGANDRVRVAVCGVRGRGNDHIHGFSQVPNTEIAALCDVDENVLNRRLGDVEKRGLLGASARGQRAGIGDGDRRERRDGGLNDVRLPAESGRGGCLRDAAWRCSEQPHQGGKGDAAPRMRSLLVCHRGNHSFLCPSCLSAATDEAKVGRFAACAIRQD